MVRRPRLAGGVFALLGAVAAVLSFADRAPDVVVPAVASFARAVEGVTGIEWFGGRGLPFELDTIGHVVIWSTLGVASWWTFRGRIPAIAQSLLLFAVSALVEVGQLFLTTTRIPDPADLVANAVGIAGGLTTAMAIGFAIDAGRQPMPEPVRVGRPTSR